MPAPCQIVQKSLNPPSVGWNGYQGFLNKLEILAKGSVPFNTRNLPCDILVQHDVGIKTLNGIKVLETITPYDMGLKPETLSGLEKFEAIDPADFVPRGYAVINADTRGVGDSEGMCIIMGMHQEKDGYDCIEAIARMPW